MAASAKFAASLYHYLQKDPWADQTVAQLNPQSSCSKVAGFLRSDGDSAGMDSDQYDIRGCIRGCIHRKLDDRSGSRIHSGSRGKVEFGMNGIRFVGSTDDGRRFPRVRTASRW